MATLSSQLSGLSPVSANDIESLDLGKKIIARRHVEWATHQLRWRWLLDSYEGGQQYRTSIYGIDRRGMPIYNLTRHKREYPDPHEFNNQASVWLGLGSPIGPLDSLGAYGATAGMSGGLGTASAAAPGLPASDPTAVATDDDFELRRARTPPPNIIAEVIETHLSEIFSQEIDRDAQSAAEIDGWWEDVDGCGTSIDEWMQDTIAPLLYTFGMLDIAFDHPKAPADSPPPITQADVNRLGINRCVASYILPQNMVWWRLDADGRSYLECLVLEWRDAPDTGYPLLHYRHWTPIDSTLYDIDGRRVEVIPHAFGVVPIVRVFDRRKHRCKHIGHSRVETIAELQRELYNRSSELILSDTTQAHPLLQGPEDYVQADGTVPIGPNWLLPKKKNNVGGDASYEGFDVVDFPKDGAESLRLNIQDLRDSIDRQAHLTKPAGVSGSTANSVSQSGTSKQLDHKSGNRLLAKLSSIFARVERTMVEYAAIVLNDGDRVKVDRIVDAVEISYPKSFDLFDGPELASMIDSIQQHLAMAGAAPLTEGELIKSEIRMALPGRSDEEYQAIDEEIDEHLAEQAVKKEQDRESAIAVGARTQADAENPTDDAGQAGRIASGKSRNGGDGGDGGSAPNGDRSTGDESY